MLFVAMLAGLLFFCASCCTSWPMTMGSSRSSMARTSTVWDGDPKFWSVGMARSSVRRLPTTRPRQYVSIWRQARSTISS